MEMAGKRLATLLLVSHPPPLRAIATCLARMWISNININVYGNRAELVLM